MNTSTKVWITFQPAGGQRRDRVHCNLPVEGNQIVHVSKRAHGYSCQQREKGIFLSGQMSARVGKGLIGVRSPRGIEWYRPRSVSMPVAPSSQQFQSTCQGNSSTKVCIAIQPVVGQHRDRVRWHPPVEGNRIVYVSKRPHSYRGQQEEKGRYLTRYWPMSARVRLGLIAIR